MLKKNSPFISKFDFDIHDFKYIKLMRYTRNRTLYNKYIYLAFISP